MVRCDTSVFQGGYYSHGKQFIKDLPIPVPPEPDLRVVEGIVAQLIEAIDAVNASPTAQQRVVRQRHANVLREQIEGHISAFFDLSADDMEVIRAVPSPY